MYRPLVLELPKIKNNLELSDLSDKKVLLSTSINYPLFSYGFHSYLHRTKSAMSITENLETKDKFYYIVSPFEHKTLNYKEDMEFLTKKFFKEENEPEILSRAFYKMWEMLYLFDLVGKDSTIATLAEGPGAFIQAIIKYKEYFGLEGKDKIFGVTIHSENKNHIEMGKQFLSYYEGKKPNLINIHKTYPSKTAMKYKSRDNGDITQVKTISNFKKDIVKDKKQVDLVTADGGFEWKDENYQEQEAYQLVLGQIVGALRVQGNGGNFVLKLFESFTEVTIKMILILMHFYDNCYLYKPRFSRTSNSERYIICKGFKYNQVKDKKYLDTIITNLEEALEMMSSELFVSDIFTNLTIPEELKNKIKYYNITLANEQQIMINKIVLFIKGNNYYGEDYHNYLNQQIKAINWWVDNFYNKTKQLENRKQLLSDVDYHESEYNNFIKLLD